MRACDRLIGVPENLWQFTPEMQSEIVIAAFAANAEAHGVCAKRHQTLVEWIDTEE